MSSESKIEHRNMGYSWSYNIEIEKVVPVEGTRASAKTTEKYSLSGNTETYEDSFSQMINAKKDLEESNKHE